MKKPIASLFTLFFACAAFAQTGPLNQSNYFAPGIVAVPDAGDRSIASWNPTVFYIHRGQERTFFRAQVWLE